MSDLDLAQLRRLADRGDRVAAAMLVRARVRVGQVKCELCADEGVHRRVVEVDGQELHQEFPCPKCRLGDYVRTEDPAYRAHREAEALASEAARLTELSRARAEGWTKPCDRCRGTGRRRDPVRECVSCEGRGWVIDFSRRPVDQASTRSPDPPSPRAGS